MRGLISVVVLGGFVVLAHPLAAATRGKVEITVVDQDTQKPIAVRVHLRDERGRPVRPPKSVYWKNHFVFDGTTVLELLPGTYTFEMERGPEYKQRTGNFVIERRDEDIQAVTMERFADLKQEGWWSGDLHVHRPLENIELLMQAEDLHVAPVITWWNKTNAWSDKEVPADPLVRFDENRFYHQLAGEDERKGGALLYFNLDAPLPITKATPEYPSPSKFLEMARQHAGVHVDIEKPFWWDVPVWIAMGQVDSIGLANNHLWRDGMLANEAWGKPRDTTLYPNPHGNGRWSQDIYYQLLNCGLQIPPSAGSASGVLPNPVGYNRVYVYCGGDFSHEGWWEGLRAGRVFVTNGPLLRPKVNGELPGHVFSAGDGESVELDIALKLATREKIEYLEIIKNGQVHREVRLDEYAKAGGRLPMVTFQESGWLLVRAVTNNEKTYRYASTGPYYVQIGNQPRISRKSAQFFLDWVFERARQLDLDDPDQKKRVLQYHLRARDYWQDLVDKANAD